MIKEDYSLKNLIKVNVRNRDFKMFMQPRFSQYYVNQDYEQYSSQLILNYLTINSIFVDVGAHYGYYSILVSRENSQIKTIAFEPLKNNFAVLKKNIKLNRLTNINPINAAISDRSGKHTFLITEASDSSGFTGHPAHKVLKRVTVKTYSLDSFFKNKKIDIVKIDTEGNELAVLNGMKDIIKNNNIKIFLEFNIRCLNNSNTQPVDILKFLENNNFINHAIDDKNFRLERITSQNWQELSNDKGCFNVLAVKKGLIKSLLFFSHTAGLGGSERSLLELIKELQEQNVICHVVLPYDGPLVKKLREIAVDYIIINYQWWCSSDALTKEQQDNIINESLTNLLKNKHTLDLWDADVVFTNTLTIPWGSIYAQLTRKPHLTFIREFGDLDFNFKFFYGYKNSIKYFENHSNYVFTNSKATLNHVSKYIDKKNLDYSYTYINVAKDLKSTKILSCFKSEHSLKLMITGGILPTKNQLEAVVAVNKLILKGHHIELAILGPVYKPKYLDKINSFIEREKIDSNIHVLGFKENPYPYMQQADIALVCSKNESYGRVTIENLALKKPVIATNSGANPEFIINGYNGYLYTYNNPDQLADHIEKFINNKKRINIMGINSYKMYKKIIKQRDYGPKIYKKLKSIVISHKRIRNNLDNLFDKEIVKICSKVMNNFGEILQINKNLEQEIMQVKTNYQQELNKVYSSKTWKALYFYKKLTGFFKKYLLNQNAKMF